MATRKCHLKTAGTTKADTINGSTGNDVFDGRGGADTITGKGGYDTYLFRTGYGHLTISNTLTGGTKAQGELDLGKGLTAQKLWFSNSGGDLAITVLGSQDLVTVKGWFGSNVSSQFAEICGYDGLNLDSQTPNLVAAMATYAANHTGFNPATATQMPTDAALQTAITAAWHHSYKPPPHGLFANLGRSAHAEHTDLPRLRPPPYTVNCSAIIRSDSP